MVTAPSLRIVYFGTPDFAVPPLTRLLASRHRVVAVVSQPDRPRGRGHRLTPTATKRTATEARVPVLQPDRIRAEAFLREVATLSPELGVVAAYGRLLPEALLQIPTLGMINVHGSLLPAWRGAAPVHRAVMAGDTETGVTIMRVVRELDAGPVFAEVRRPIGLNETSIEVERDLAVLGADLLVQVVDALAEGRAHETPQDDARATYAPKILKSEGAIDWTLTAASIHNHVRGLQPWPLVSGRLGDERVLVHQTMVPGEPTTAPAGTVVQADGDRLDIAAGDAQVVRILRLQPEGRRVMTAREFLAGRRLPANLRIERG